MLISCTSCDSKYLVNSADLKPDGRTVQCANCGNQWYQEAFINENEEIINESILTNEDQKKSESLKFKESNKPTFNLPSTYVKKQQVSIINSIAVLLCVFFFIGGFFIVKNIEINTLVLLKFYIDEFYFNLKLIIDDIANIIHKLINFF